MVTRIEPARRVIGQAGQSKSRMAAFDQLPGQLPRSRDGLRGVLLGKDEDAHFGGSPDPPALPYFPGFRQTVRFT
jgi:hypothetical protein